MHDVKGHSSPDDVSGSAQRQRKPPQTPLRSFGRSNLSALSDLLTLPVLIIVVVAALDSADKGLLAASFPMLEKQLGMDVKTLGYFSLFTNLSYSLSLPCWGWCVHRYGISESPTILAGACLLWGAACWGIAIAGKSVVMQGVLRAMNGFAIGSIMPLSQTMLVSVVNKSMLGRAFGLMSLAEKLAGTVASASIIWFDNWERPYIAVGFLSLVAAIFVRRYLVMKADDRDNNDIEADGEDKKKMTIGQIARRIARQPPFLCLVGQGVFGGIPWDMMSFLLLLFEWRGLSREQIVSIQFAQGIAATIGAPLGGFLGDHFAYHSRGRIFVAIVSVLMGAFAYAMFLFSTSYRAIIFWNMCFYFVSGWVPSAACRPICADLAQNSSERAQVIALWVLLEKISASIFGAPLVGYLTSCMIEETAENGAAPEKAGILAFNLFFLSTIFWLACGAFWMLMAYFIDPSSKTSRHFADKKEEYRYEKLNEVVDSNSSRSSEAAC